MPGLSTIGQIAIKVNDLQRAVAFYRDQLGIKHLFDAGGMSFFDAGGVRLMLSMPDQKNQPPYSALLYFKVDNLQASYDELRSKGVDFKREPGLIARMPDHELWMAFFEDSEGNLMALMSEVRAA